MGISVQAENLVQLSQDYLAAARYNQDVSHFVQTLAEMDATELKLN